MVGDRQDGLGPQQAEDLARLREESLQALRESEERYRSLVIATSQIVWNTDATGQVVPPLVSWCAYTGQTEAEVQGWGWLQAIHPHDRQRAIEGWQQAIAAKNLYELEYRLRSADGSYRDFAVRGVPIVQEDGSIREWVGTCSDITERKRSETAQRLLTEASSLCAASLDCSIILKNLTRLAVGTLADYCYFDLLNARGQLQRVAWQHADADKQDWFNQIQHYLPDPNSDHPLLQCLSSGESIWVAEVDEAWLQTLAVNPDHWQFLQALELSSLLVVPLAVHDRHLGTLTLSLTSSSQRHYTLADLQLAEELARRTALAVDNAHLYRTTQETEQNLRQALIILGEHQQQLRTLQRLTDLLNQRLTNLRSLLQFMVDAIYEAIPSAEFSFIVLQNPYTYRLELTAVAGTGVEQFQPGDTFAPGEGILGQIFQVGGSQLFRAPLPDQPLFATSGTSALPAALCVVAIGSAQAGKLGVLAIGNWSNPDALSVENLQLLVAFGEQAAIALTNAKLINTLEEREERLAIQNRVLGKQNRRLERQRQQIQYQNLKLREAARLKSQFLATMSHELRTPMNAIIGFSQLLLRQAKLNPQQRDMVERILNNGRNLLALVNDILDLSRIETGRLELKPEPLNLATLVTTTAEELRSLAQQKNLALQVHINLENPHVVNDQTRLRQVLANLLSNALKFTETGQVNVVAEEVDAETIALEVRDTGIGIAEADLEHIFEEFHQVDQTLAKKFSGTGLGLAITDLLVQMMKGQIIVKSELGKGSTFRVQLPRSVASAST